MPDIEPSIIKIDQVPCRIKLDDKCWSCEGDPEKKPALADSDGTCSVCHGTGVQLTDAGRAVLAFLKRHLPITSLR